MPNPYLIGIAGPSGSGKTTLALTLAEALGGTVFSLDNYYRPLGHLTYEERCRCNFDHPNSIDDTLLAEHLRGLAAGGEIERPIYDFTTHTRRREVERVRASDYLIVEGLFTLYWPDVRELFRTKVFVELEDPVCYERRLDRDVRERGRTPESVLAQYTATVRPMCLEFILPTRRFADVVVSGKRPLEQSRAAVLEHVRAHAALDRFA